MTGLKGRALPEDLRNLLLFVIFCLILLLALDINYTVEPMDFRTWLLFIPAAIAISLSPVLPQWRRCPAAQAMGFDEVT